MALSAFWKAFRRQRRAELEAEGFSKHDARHLAHNEAKNRAKGEPLVGRGAALSAGIWTDYRDDGTCGTYLVVPEDSVPSSFLPKAKAWAAMPHSAVQ